MELVHASRKEHDADDQDRAFQKADAVLHTLNALDLVMNRAREAV